MSPEPKGDYWLTQLLCLEICMLNGVLETQETIKEIEFNIHELRSSVVPKLSETYYPSVKEFCRGKRFRRSNDPYYRLLKSFSEQDNSIVDLSNLSDDLGVKASINNIKEHRLSILLETKPLCSRYFYYNSETKNFAVEDPALFYFLKHIDWDQVRRDCGFKDNVSSYEYDFAISFAGSHRDLARAINKNLEILDFRVFFDENYESNYLGKTWSREFEKVFSKDSKFVICLLDKDHLDRIWPTFERECFVPRVSNGEVIPIYLDDTVFVGIPRDVVGIMYKNYIFNEDDIIEKIVYKLVDRADNE